MDWLLVVIWIVSVAAIIACSRMGRWYHREAQHFADAANLVTMVDAQVREHPEDAAALMRLLQAVAVDNTARFAIREATPWYRKVQDGGRVDEIKPMPGVEA